jgi:hypothetical protein
MSQDWNISNVFAFAKVQLFKLIKIMQKILDTPWVEKLEQSEEKCEQASKHFTNHQRTEN